MHKLGCDGPEVEAHKYFNTEILKYCKVDFNCETLVHKLGCNGPEVVVQCTKLLQSTFFIKDHCKDKLSVFVQTKIQCNNVKCCAPSLLAKRGRTNAKIFHSLQHLFTATLRFDFFWPTFLATTELKFSPTRIGYYVL